MRPWFQRDPDLLEREITALQELGARVEVDEEARASGVLRLVIDYPGAAGSLRLMGIYPDLYPFFRPEVFAPELDLPRHQQPISKALCLIGRRTSRWYAQDTLATLLRTQLPHLVAMADGGPIEAVVPFEEPQGEPASDYYNHESPPESFLLFDGDWLIDPAAKAGTFGALVRKVQRSSPPEITVQGYVTEVRDLAGRVLAKRDGPALLGMDERVTGRWLRLEQPILGNINHVLDGLGEGRNWLQNEPSWPMQRHLALSALLFPEEVQHRQHADGWAAIQWLGSRRHKGQPRHIIGTFARTARAGVGDLAARMPATRTLQGRSIAVFGVGAIGAPAVLELARAGVGRLLLVDHDFVDPATVRRWPFGVTAFGATKVDVLKHRIAADYPWTDIATDTMRVGSVEDASENPRQGDHLEELLAGCDLVIDCTAEMGVNHFLSEFTRVRRIPYLLGNATPGGWGGMVASFRESDACWLCLRDALYGAQSVPLPPADPQGELQPPGCADPTFTGTAFDLTEVSLEIARTAAGLLTNDKDGYPAPEWQLAVLELRAADGRRVQPSWRAAPIARRRGCGCEA